MKKIPHCSYCGKDGHYQSFCPIKPHKPIHRSKLHENVYIKKSNSIEFEVIKKPKTKKPSRSKIKKELDKLVKDYVKERDNHTCQHCGKIVSGKSCQGSHVFSVGSCSVLQFEPLNIKTLCGHCHLWWHSTPIEAAQWFERKFPERLAQLNVLKQTKTKTSTVELQELINKYKQINKDF